MKQNRYRDSQIMEILKEAESGISIPRLGREHKIKPLYIQPGKPHQNASIEIFNRTVRYEGLNQAIFHNI